tara:strand:- start:172 stop:528 length:357 start_codon:yes stop_codon:yes gene_type:complete
MIDYRFIWSEFSWKMYDAASIMFDDSKNDLRSLPKTVRLQLLITLSTVWSTVFSTLAFESIYEITYGWGGLVFGHILFIFATYYTFHTFKNAKEQAKKTVGIRTYDECYDYLEKKDRK